MTDYKALAERVLEAEADFDAHYFEDEKYQLVCPKCDGRGELYGRDYCPACNMGTIWDDETIKRDRIDSVAAVLKEALTLEEQSDSDIDVAIRHALDVAEDMEPCDCAREHRQLAAWLTELKQCRQKPTWEPLPRQLPEGAAYGYYRIRRKDIHKFIQPPTCWNRTDVTVEREYWAAREGLPHREFMLIAAFDEHDNPVVNGEVI